MRDIRLKIYQTIYNWALDRMRRTMGNLDLRKPTAKLSNHALIRYAERFDGYDFDKATKILLTDEVKEKVKEIGGNGKFTLNGIYYIVTSGRIVTVAKPEGVKEHLTYAPVDGTKGRRWTF